MSCRTGMSLLAWPIVWLVCCLTQLCSTQICSSQSENSLECQELESLKDLNNLRDTTPTIDSWQSFTIRNEHTELSIGADSSVPNLANLTVLDLSHVPRLELLEGGFSLLPNLRRLNISGCALNQLLATHFASDSALQLLDASHNELTTLTKDFFDNLRKLVDANFTHNALTHLELPDMPLLRQLHLGHNELANLSFGNCPHLQQLILNDNQLSLLNATSFRGLNGLLELQLSGNYLNDIGKNTFQPLMQLRLLNLSSNALGALRQEAFGSSSVQQFALQQMDLSSNNIRLLFDNQFRLLGRLQVLDLSHNSISSLSAPHFVGLQSLRKLYLQSNDIIEIKTHTFGALQDLDTLDLSHNSIESLAADTFGSKTFPRMRKLNLKTNNLKRLHALAFSSMPFLEYLSLGNNELRGLDVRMFAPMRRLQKMHVGHNLLEEIKSDILESLNSVTDLLIDNNKLTFLPNLNGTLPNLKRVAIEGNPWQCACFVQLEHWLLSKNVMYLREGTGFYNGEKPLCVVTADEHCVQNIQDDRHQGVLDEFEEHLNGEQASAESSELD